MDIPYFLLELGERIEIPPKEQYELIQPTFLPENKKWRWIVRIWNKETKESYFKDMFEDEIALREAAWLFGSYYITA